MRSGMVARAVSTMRAAVLHGVGEEVRDGAGMGAVGTGVSTSSSVDGDFRIGVGLIPIGIRRTATTIMAIRRRHRPTTSNHSRYMTVAGRQTTPRSNF